MSILERTVDPIWLVPCQPCDKGGVMLTYAVWGLKGWESMLKAQSFSFMSCTEAVEAWRKHVSRCAQCAHWRQRIQREARHLDAAISIARRLESVAGGGES